MTNPFRDLQLAPWLEMKLRLLDLIPIEIHASLDRRHIVISRCPSVRQRWLLRKIDAMIASVQIRQIGRAFADPINAFPVDWSQLDEGVLTEPYA